MKNNIFDLALIAMSLSSSTLAATNIGGNWYGQSVERIQYTNLGLGGTFEKVSDMSNGQCKFEPVTYTGLSTGPLGEVSWHFRGPMHLKQFAFYTPGSSKSKRTVRPASAQRRHAHLHQERAADLITATINGKVVSWANPGSGSPATARPASSSTQLSWSKSTPAAPINAGAGKWARQAYYSAENATADGLVSQLF